MPSRIGIFTPQMRSTAFGGSGLGSSWASKGRQIRINDAINAGDVRFILMGIFILALCPESSGQAAFYHPRVLRSLVILRGVGAKSSWLSPALGQAGRR